MSLTPWSGPPDWAPVEKLVELATARVIHHPLARQVKRSVDEATTAIARAEEKVLGASERLVLEGFPRPVQGDNFSCGAQVAYAIAAYHGRARSVSAVMKAVGTTTEGTSSGQLATYFRARGLRARTISSATMADLRAAIRAGAPAVVSMDGDHWAAVYGYEPGAIYLADPAFNRCPRVRAPLAEFRRRWDAWAMVVSA